MVYTGTLEERVVALEQKITNLEEIFNKFLDKIYPAEHITEEEAQELEKRLEDILTGSEKPIDWGDLERELSE